MKLGKQCMDKMRHLARKYNHWGEKKDKHKNKKAKPETPELKNTITELNISREF